MREKLIKYSYDNDIDNVHDVGLDYKSNEIYITGNPEYVGWIDGEPGVEYSMSSTFIKNINIISRKSTKPILIHLKSCGGLWEEGIAMYDAIKLCRNKITILSYTHARSMSSLIFSAADHRVMMPNSTFMFHQGTFVTEGTVKQAFTDLEELKRTNQTMEDIYVETLKSGKGSMAKKSVKHIRSWLKDEMDKKEDVYITSKDAVAMGFADCIYDGDYKNLTNPKHYK